MWEGLKCFEIKIDIISKSLWNVKNYTGEQLWAIMSNLWK